MSSNEKSSDKPDKSTSKPATGGGKKKKDGADRRKRVRFLKKLAQKMESKLEEEEVKASVSDWVRLLQLQKELEEEQLKEVEVTWVDPSEKENVTKT